MIEVAAKKNVANPGAMTSASKLPSSWMNAKSVLTFFWMPKVEKAKTERARSAKRPMT